MDNQFVYGNVIVPIGPAWNSCSTFKDANGYVSWVFHYKNGSVFTPPTVKYGDKPTGKMPIELIEVSQSTGNIAPSGEKGAIAQDIQVNDPEAYVTFTASTDGKQFITPNSIMVQQNNGAEEGASAFYCFATPGYNVTEENDVQTGELDGSRYYGAVFCADTNSSYKATCLLAGDDTQSDTIEITIRFISAGRASAPSIWLLEKAVASVDVEYAIGDADGTVPSDNAWSTTLDISGITGKYLVWQRVKVTYIDGTSIYTDPVCLADTVRAGATSITEIYTLHNGNLAQSEMNQDDPDYCEAPFLPTKSSDISSDTFTSFANSKWSFVQPIWSPGPPKVYVWTASYFQYEDGTYSFSGPYYAELFNNASESAQEANEAVEALDESLDQEGVFNRLTNNGKRQGIFLDMDTTYRDSSNGLDYHPLYINASYIQAGTLHVGELTSDGSYDEDKTIFYASIDTKDVYIGDFQVSSTYIKRNKEHLWDYTVGDNKGIFIGSNSSSSSNVGIAVSDGVNLMIMRNGTLFGRNFDSDTTTDGYISFSRYDSDYSRYGMTLAGRYLALVADNIYVDDSYNSATSSGSWYKGLTTTVTFIDDVSVKTQSEGYSCNVAKTTTVKDYSSSSSGTEIQVVTGFSELTHSYSAIATVSGSHTIRFINGLAVSS